MNKAPAWARHLEQSLTRVPHLQRHDPNRLNHISDYAFARFDLGKLAVLPSGLPKPPNIAQAWSLFKHGTTQCCWVELCSRHIPLCRGWEQYTPVGGWLASLSQLSSLHIHLCSWLPPPPSQLLWGPCRGHIPHPWSSLVKLSEISWPLSYRSCDLWCVVYLFKGRLILQAYLLLQWARCSLPIISPASHIQGYCYQTCEASQQGQ